MAQEEQKRQLSRMERALAQMPQEPASEPMIDNGDAAGTVVRTGAGMAAIPLALRIVSGLASTPFSTAPGVGTAIAGGISGLGEAAAQMVEEGTIDPRKLNKSRIAVEAGLGATPLGKASVIKNMLKSGALAGAGIIGRKATDDDPNTSAIDLSSYGKGDAFNLALGTGMGALFGRGAKPALPTKAPKKLTIEDVLKTGRWKAEDIERTAARAAALGDEDMARGLRLGSAKTGTGTTGMYERAAADKKKDLDQTVRNENAREKFQKQQWQQEARNMNAAEKAQQTIDEAKATADKLEEMLAEGAVPQTVVRKTSKMATGDGQVSATTTLKSADPDDVPAQPQTIAERPAAPAGQTASKAAPKAAAPKDAPKMPEAPTPPVKAPEAPAAKQPEAPKAPEAAPTAAAAPELAGPKLPMALAFRVAQASQVPEGQQFARFFRNKGQVETAQQYANKMSPELQGLFRPILAQYEAQTAKSPMKHGEGSLGELLSQLRDAAGLPRQVRNLKPQAGSPKSQGIPAKAPKIPEVAGPAAAPTAPKADLPDAPAAAPQAPSQAADPNLIPGQAEKYKNLSKEMLPPTTGLPMDKLDPKALALRQYELENSIGDVERAVAGHPQAEGVQPELLGMLREYTNLTNEVRRRSASAIEEAATEQQGLGKLRDESGAIRQELLTQLGLGATGALSGAAMSEDDPVSGAILGGAAGLAGGKILGGLSSGVHIGEGLRPMDKVVNSQRAAMLSNPTNLGVNFLAPTGGATLGSIEKMLTGAVERMKGEPVTESLNQGISGLKHVLNPMRFKNFGEDFREASQRIEHAEGRGDMIGGNEDLFDKIVSFPARFMSTGDMGARNALQKAGIAEDTARAMTVSGEPRYEVTKSLVDLARRTPVNRLLLPFSRTAGNVIESSLERAPIVGWFMTRASHDPELQATISERIARQGLGAVVGGIAYLAGTQVDPYEAKAWSLPLIIANMSGQYGALAAAAFAAGQAGFQGKDGIDQIETGAKRFSQDLPLPTTEVFLESLKAAENYAREGMADPNAVNMPQRYLPNPFLPRALTDDNLSRFTDSAKQLSRWERALQEQP
jgi:hypothetical protein